MWEKNLSKNGYMHMYDWVTLLYSRNYHNLVSQLHFNKNLKVGSSLCGTAEMNPTSIHEDVGSILGLPHWVKDPVML